MKITKTIKSAIVDFSQSFKGYWETTGDFTDEYMDLMIKSAIERILNEVKNISTKEAAFMISDEALWYREKTV